MADRNYFSALSLELIEKILLQFARPSDLLSLALTERRLSSIIIPNFLEYCCLNFSIHRWDIWERLEQQSLACSRVGRLELEIDDYQRPHFQPPPKKTTLLPQSLSSMKTPNISKEDLDNTICNVVMKMPNLKQIVITGGLDDRDSDRRVPLRELFALVRGVYGSGCGLDGIVIGLPYFASWTMRQFDLSFEKVLSDAHWLSHMKICSISLCYLFPDPDDHNSLGPELNSHLLRVLFLMPNLTHLQLDIPDRRSLLTDDMICHWPKLEFLHLSYRLPPRRYSMSTGMLSYPLPAPVTVQHFDLEAFIASHPHLYTIYLFLEGVTLTQHLSRTTAGDKSMVPTLKNFAYTSGATMIPGSLKNVRLAIRNLSHLTIMPSCLDDLAIIGELESLESCVVQQSSTMEIEAAMISTIFRGCKSLKRLFFHSSYLPLDLTPDDPVFALSQDLPNLTHLLGTSSPDRCFLNPDHSDAVLKRLYKFPKLRYIDCYCPQQVIIFCEERPLTAFRFALVELKRDVILEQMAYEFLGFKSPPESCCYSLWGDFLCADQLL